jgi:hypothetical protein
MTNLPGYVDFVTETFGQYTTEILAMIEEAIASAAKTDPLSSYVSGATIAVTGGKPFL